MRAILLETAFVVSTLPWSCTFTIAKKLRGGKVIMRGLWQKN